jgi:hypothetical protein
MSYDTVSFLTDLEESFFSKSPSLKKGRSLLSKLLKEEFPSVHNDGSFVSFLLAYLTLRKSVNELIAELSLNTGEDSAPLGKLYIVELETRVQGFKAHILRVLSEETDSEREYLMVVCEKILFEFLPDIARSYIDLQLVAKDEESVRFHTAVLRNITLFKELSAEVVDYFEKNKVDDILSKRMNLER